MSEGSGKNEMANALGGVAAVVIVIVFIVVGMGKLLTWIWLTLLAPLFLGTVFYALPFVVASGVMGDFWFAASRFTQEEKGGDFRLLAAMIPLCGLLIFGVIGFPKDTPWVLAVAPTPKAKVHRQKIKFTPKELAFIQSVHSIHDHPPLLSAMNPLPGEAATPERATAGMSSSCGRVPESRHQGSL